MGTLQHVFLLSWRIKSIITIIFIYNHQLKQNVHLYENGAGSRSDFGRSLCPTSAFNFIDAFNICYAFGYFFMLLILLMLLMLFYSFGYFLVFLILFGAINTC